MHATRPRRDWLAISGGLLLTVLGAGSLYVGIVDRDGVGIGVGLFMLGLGVPALVTQHLNGRVAPTRAPAALQTHRGKAVTVLPTDPPARQPVMVVVLLTCVLAMVGATVYVADGYGLSGTWPFAAVGLYLLAALGFIVTGRIGSGGIRLDPAGVGQHLGGRDQWIAWDDVVMIEPEPGTWSRALLHARPGATVVCRATVPPLVRGGRRPAEGIVRLDVTRVGVGLVELGWVLDLYLRFPHLRAGLGTPQSVDDIGRHLEQRGVTT